MRHTVIRILKYFRFKIIRLEVSVQDALSTFMKLRPHEIQEGLLRIGGMNDGSYLIPNNLIDFDFLISPGVGEVTEFELFFANKGIPCLLIDGTIEKPPNEHENFTFIKKNLDIVSTAKTITIEDAVKLHKNRSKNLILQMDIEGNEYKILLDTSKEILDQFKLIVLELHNLDLIEYGFFDEIFNVFLSKILVSHKIIHFHANNGGTTFNIGRFQLPTTVEITLVRNDYVNFTGRFASVPNKLDSPNISGRKPIVIDFGKIEAYLITAAN